MSESQRHHNQEPSEREIRAGYLGVLGLQPEAMADIGTPELGEIAYEMRACELGAPPLPATKDLPPFADK